MKAIVRVDSKGRITIPLYIREEVGVEPESYVEISVNNKKEIIIKPVTKSGELIISMKIVLREPKDIVHIIDKLIKEGADVIEFKCRKEEGEFICTIILSVIDYTMASHIKNVVNKEGLTVLSMESVGRLIE